MVENAEKWNKRIETILESSKEPCILSKELIPKVQAHIMLYGLI